MDPQSWTLEELSERAQTELDRRHVASPGGRVAAALNARTIRYYTTLGLVDRPVSYQAGLARYGPRHLLQLLAIKVLQAEFLPLPEIQRRLYGRSEAELQQMVEAATAAAPSDNGVALQTWLACQVVPGLNLIVEDREQFLDWMRSHPAEEVADRLQKAFQTLLNPKKHK